jgi:hypothetical protein
MARPDGAAGGQAPRAQLSRAVGKTERLLLAFRRCADDNQNALRFVL